MSDVNVQPKKSMEEPMVDIAHILAAYLEQEIRDNKIVTEPLRQVLDNVGKRRFIARIYELEKEEVNMGVYVTDKRGVVIFDSNNGQWEGEDFSKWHDVLKTMRGEYGARTTRLDPDDPDFRSVPSCLWPNPLPAGTLRPTIHPLRSGSAPRWPLLSCRWFHWLL